MHTQTDILKGGSLASQRAVTSFHYGPPDAEAKAYVQASLHADELPGMLVAHHLRQRLAALEDAGRLRARVVVVPVANPIGLSQAVSRSPVGRFELAGGENFNRHYPALADPVRRLVEGRLGADGAANARVIRAALRQAAAAQPATNELASLRKTLLALACDAEVVLDLHCDNEAVVHLYTAPTLWPQCEPLARLLGAEASLLALESGDDPFDEACSQTWWKLADALGDGGRVPIPHGCLSVTVELRGEADVTQALAASDADALIDFFIHRGIVDGPAPDLQPLRHPATPLAGTEVITSPISGVVAFSADCGQWLRKGDAVCEVIDPLAGTSVTLRSGTDGVLFARVHQRYTVAGRPLAKVAGAEPLRSGKLSSE